MRHRVGWGNHDIATVGMFWFLFFKIPHETEDLGISGPPAESRGLSIFSQPHYAAEIIWSVQERTDGLERIGSPSPYGGGLA